MLSYWEKDIFKPKYDFIIIGGGFSGLWLAYFLKKKNNNAKIAILEKGTLPQGASTKNAGFACFGSPTEILENIDTLGLETAMEWTKKRFDGIGIIKENFGSSIDYNPCGATELFRNNEDFQNCLMQLEELNKNLSEVVAYSNHFFIDKTIIADANFVGFKHAISNNIEASIHSGKLYYSLFQNLIAAGVMIFQGTNVLSIDSENAKVFTDKLGDFEANHISICTNAFTEKIYPEYKIKPGRGQVLITEPIKGLKWNKTFHLDQGYYYFRNVGNRVLLGGGRNLDFEGETTDKFETSEIIQNQLEKLLRENILTHQNFKIDMRWAGIMAFNETKIPHSEVISSKLSANVCMNGMGVALAPSLGQSLAEIIA